MIREKWLSGFGFTKVRITAGALCVFALITLGVFLAKSETVKDVPTEISPDVTNILRLGEKDFDDGNYVDALINFRNAVKKSPKDAAANFWLGRTYYQLGEDQLAQTHLQKAVDRSPKKSNYHYWLGRVQCALNKFNQAEKNLEKSLHLYSENAATHTWLGLCHLHHAEYDPSSSQSKKHLKQAVSSLNQALQLDPTSADAHRLLAHTYQKLHRTNKALQHMGEAVGWAQWDWQIAFEMGEMLAENKNHRKALDHLVRAVALHPDPESAPQIYLAVGKSSCYAGLFDSAIRALKKAAELEPESTTEIYYWLGWAYYGKGQYTVSQELLDEFLKRQPDNRKGLYWSALCEFRQLNYQAARKKLMRLVQQRPKGWSYRYWLGRTLFWTAEYDEAAEHLRQATEINPSYPNNYWWLAQALLARGDLEGAARTAYQLKDKTGDDRGLDALRELHSFAPKSELINRLTGILSFKQGNFKEAVDYLTTASKAPIAKSTTFTYLGWSYLAMGELDKADACFERAIEMNAEETFSHQGTIFLALARDDVVPALDKVKSLSSEKSLHNDDDQMRQVTAHVWALLKSGNKARIKNGHRLRGNLSSLGVVGCWTRGLRVVHVIHDTPAQRAGVKPGDLITRMNLTLLNDWTPEQDQDKQLNAMSSGKTVLLTVWRKGTELGIIVDVTNVGK